MNVAYMLGSLNRGGTETLLLDVCGNLNDSEIHAFLYHRKGGSLEDKFRETNVPMIQLAPKSIASLIPYLLKLRRSFRQHNIEIVHAQQSLDAVFASIATAGTGIKVVQTFHGYDFNHSTIQRFLMRLSVFFCNASYFVSNTQREYYLKKYKIFKKRFTAVIYNGIDFNRIKNADQSTILEEYNVSEKTLKFAMVGNFVPVRDHITICRFLNLLNQKDIDFRFFFIGAKDPSNPELYDQCITYCAEHKLNEKVIFTGSRSDVPGILKKIDAIIYSSNHDTFGIAVLESMLTGKLIFINNLPVFREITENEPNIIFYESGDDTDLLRKFLQFKDSLMLKSESSINSVKEKYGISSHIESLNNKYVEEINLISNKNNANA